MAREDVKVNLPVGDPDGTVKLTEKIVARNTAMGATSPVSGDFDFTAIAAQAAAAKLLRTEADAADRLSQKDHQGALSLLGIAQGQNLQSPGTIYTETTRIRDILLVKYKTNPETLELWGFNVVIDQTEGKRTVRVEIPTESPDKFITLAGAIVAQNTAEGAASPLSGKIDMAVYASRATDAGTMFNNAASKRAEKEAKHGEALAICGYAAGQTSETEGTLYQIITQVRDLLLAVYHTNPEELSVWGYDVVVSSSSHGGEEEPTTP